MKTIYRQMKELASVETEAQILAPVIKRLPPPLQIASPRPGDVYVVWPNNDKIETWYSEDVLDQIRGACKACGHSKSINKGDFYEFWARSDGSYPICIGKQKVDAYSLACDVSSIYFTPKQKKIIQEVKILLEANLGKFSVDKTFGNAIVTLSSKEPFTNAKWEGLLNIGMAVEGNFYKDTYYWENEKTGLRLILNFSKGKKQLGYSWIEAKRDVKRDYGNNQTLKETIMHPDLSPSIKSG